MALIHAKAGEKVHLPSLGSATPGRAAALVKTPEFEAVKLMLRAGEGTARHAVPGYCTIQCLEGAIVLETKERLLLAAGDWVYLDRGEEHAVSAIEDGSLLVTILLG